MEKKILLAEDTDFFLEMEKTFLERAGFGILLARDGYEALDVADREKPDIILLDLWMPRMNGDECLRRMKKDPKLRKIPVIMLTGKKADKGRCLAAGADDVVLKPVAQDELVDKIGAFLKVPVRRHPRAGVNLRVKYESLDLFLTDYASNLSCGGVFMETQSPLPQGTQTHLEFQIPEVSIIIKAKGIVVWSGKNKSGKRGMGIQFEGLNSATKKAINDYVEKSIRTKS